MPDIFISYNRDDREKARLIANALEAEGFSVWWDAALRAGETYDEVTERNLRTAGAVVVLWSKRSASSKWVRAEATVGERSSILVPALIEDCERPIRFELVQTADLRHWEGDRADPHWRGFMQDVEEAISQRASKAQADNSPSSASDDASIETAFWNSIKDGRERSEFEAYLKRYPNGHFVDLARHRLAALGRPASAAARSPQSTPRPKASAAKPAPAPAPKKENSGSILMIAGFGVALALVVVVAFILTQKDQGGGGAPAPAKAQAATAGVTTAPAEGIAQATEQETPAGEQTKLAAVEGAGSESAARNGAGEAAEADMTASATDAMNTSAPDGAAMKEAGEGGDASVSSETASGDSETGADEIAATALEEQKPAAAAGPGDSSGIAAASAPDKTKQSAPGGAFRDCPNCPLMMPIPGGDFMMGSPGDEPGRYAYEGPQHEVTIKPFAIGVYEVTSAEWKACVDDGACPRARTDDTGKLPVLGVLWKDCEAYVAWLTKKTGRKYRLPSEAEWEYAARGGSTTAYWWGDKFDRSKVPSKAPKPVGTFAANGFGLYDVLGNAREWVADCYVNNYRSAPTDGSAVRSGDCSKRVIRGGSWVNAPVDIRIANRSRIDAGTGASYMGVRVAAEIDKR